jgi:transcriptional regulator with XRE-family HTH domain
VSRCGFFNLQIEKLFQKHDGFFEAPKNLFARWNDAEILIPRYSSDKADPLHVRDVRTDLVELGSRIRAARKITGRSQEAFADLCHLDRNYFGEIERGERNPTFNILCEICTGLSCDMASLSKGIPQLPAAAQNTQVLPVPPTPRRRPLVYRPFCEKTPEPRNRSDETWHSFLQS